MDTKALRQKILDLAIRGKLVPQDPNDEPASVLLERIRAQKQQMVREGKLKSKDIKDDTVIFVGEDNLHYEKFTDGTIKCIEDEIPFELPEGWEWARLGSIAETNLGKMLDAKKNKGVPRPYLRNINVRWGSFDLSDLLEMRIQDEEVERYSVRKGDLIICEGGEPGRCAIWKDEDKVFFQKALHRVRPHLVLSEYLFIVINALSLSGFTERYFTGTTIKHLTGQSLKALLIPVPPIHEQQDIIKMVSNTLMLVDCIENNRTELVTIISSAKAYILDLAIRGQLVPQDPTDEPAAVLLERICVEKEALIKAGKLKRDKRESVIFRGEDNSYYEKIEDTIICINDIIPFELPDGWAWARGYSCFSGMESKRPAGVDFDYIDIDSIDNRNHVITEPKHMAVHDAPSRASRAVHAGSVLFSLVRPYLQNIAFIPQEYSNCIASTGFYVCNTSGALIPEFMFSLMLSPYVVNGLNQFMKGDNSPSISKDDLENWLYPIPPIAEQKRIVIHVQKALEQIGLVTSSLS